MQVVECCCKRGKFRMGDTIARMLRGRAWVVGDDLSVAIVDRAPWSHAYALDILSGGFERHVGSLGAGTADALLDMRCDGAPLGAGRALVVAAWIGDDAAVRALLSQLGAEADRLWLEKAACTAGSRGHHGTLLLLMDDGPAPLFGALKRQQRHELTDHLMRCACMKGHEAVVRLVLQRRLVSRRTGKMRIPRVDLWRVVSSGHAGVVRILLAEGLTNDADHSRAMRAADEALAKNPVVQLRKGVLAAAKVIAEHPGTTADTVAQWRRMLIFRD